MKFSQPTLQHNKTAPIKDAVLLWSKCGEASQQVARNASQAYLCEHSAPLLARRTPSNQRFEWSSRSHTTIKQKKHRAVLFCFMVEVWRFELQASSTRNWRATNCATPRFDDFYAIFCKWSNMWSDRKFANF